MKTTWNSGMDYGFSVIRAMMWMLGVWPLQENAMVYTARWVAIFIAESLTMLNLLIEPFLSCGDTKDLLEVCLIIDTGLHAWMNMIFGRMYMKKMYSNVISAIDDWSSSPTKSESYQIMTGYARVGRIITISQVIIGFVAASLYFIANFVGNNQQVVIIDNKNVTLWTFVFPSTCLYKGISYTTYKALYAMQILQAFLLFIAECASDSFFFSITMHLAGQLELLGIRFVEIVEKPDRKNRYGDLFGSWIRRHYHLLSLARNIEESFNFNLLLRLGITTIVIAVSGMRILVSVRHQEYEDMIKSLIFIQYFLVQSFLFTHAGETLMAQSESIVTAIYNTEWHELPPTTMKDLILILMKTRLPLRLSAGKFFYITRSTITDIMTTAMTYISFLQAMENEE